MQGSMIIQAFPSNTMQCLHDMGRAPCHNGSSSITTLGGGLEYMDTFTAEPKNGTTQIMPRTLSESTACCNSGSIRCCPSLLTRPAGGARRLIGTDPNSDITDTSTRSTWHAAERHRLHGCDSSLQGDGCSAAGASSKHTCPCRPPADMTSDNFTASLYDCTAKVQVLKLSCEVMCV